MNRRTSLVALTGFVVVPLAVRAQPPVVVGILDAGERTEWWAAFRQQMRELGYVEGRNVAFEQRSARGQYERLPALAEELVRLKPAAIVTTGRVATQAVLRATTTIPIVMGTGDDPVAAGLVPSFAHPRGNLTGVTTMGAALVAKRVELLREALPGLARLAVLWYRDGGPSDVGARETEMAARSSKIALHLQGVHSIDELDSAFATMARARPSAVLVVASPVFHSARHRIADLTVKLRLPTMHGGADYAEAGGLFSYAPNYPDLLRRAAGYVDRILKGARPGDLPIEQPTQVTLVINLKTAKALNLTIPPSLLLRADRVIE
jgi:putative tryptophan/tyrosine transport system substrate-binding protein